ncbi:MAG: DNA replication and repair protein RecF, partial [Candidatus Eremiobacteraeota bacterium]|nr:DNA replication and repair protein RecF [Candidatus Eremiobacteraeota bacterium]
MLLTRLSLSNMRNYAALEFVPSPGLNVFVGANAQGKSNLLEAISLLGTGKSFRTAREAELIRSGLASASIVGEARLRAGNVRLGCSIAATAHGTRKLYSINGQSVRYAKFLGSIKVVTFTPVDLHLANGPPALRRALLNTALSQESSLYFRHLARYQKTLMQKAALLRANVPLDQQLLEVYNSELVNAGTEIMLARRQFVGALADAAGSIHRQWMHG